MSQQSNESQLLRGAFVPTLVVSIVAIAVSAVVQGKSGFWGALLAQFVVIIFFVIHIAVSRLTRNLDPISTMAMALFSYFAKLFALGTLLWAIAKYTDRATINRIAFGVTAVALQNEIPESLANRSTVSSARSQIPRFGVLIILRSEISSSELTNTRR